MLINLKNPSYTVRRTAVDRCEHICVMSTEHCTVHYYSHIWALSLDLETLSFPGKLELRGKCCVIFRCQSLAGLFNSNGSIICSLVFRFWASPKFWFVSISSLVQGERCCEYWMHTQYRFWSNPKFWSVSTYLTSGQGREQQWIWWLGTHTPQLFPPSQLLCWTKMKRKTVTYVSLLNQNKK